jgi:hypothetical protein
VARPKRPELSVAQLLAGAIGELHDPALQREALRRLQPLRDLLDQWEAEASPLDTILLEGDAEIRDWVDGKGMALVIRQDGEETAVSLAVILEQHFQGAGAHTHEGPGQVRRLLGRVAIRVRRLK